MIEGDKTIDDRIMVWTAKGRLTFQEIRSKMDVLGSDMPKSRILCDLTRATIADLKTREIEDIIKLIGLKVNDAKYAKSAIVVHSSVDYGLARMFSIFSELAGLPVKVRVFRTTEVAMEWLSASYGNSLES